ncbi:alpha/beta fold hydrolase [Nocardia beijingensis]
MSRHKGCDVPAGNAPGDLTVKAAAAALLNTTSDRILVRMATSTILLAHRAGTGDRRTCRPYRPGAPLRLLAEQLPRLVELETGHCGPLEAPDEVAALLPASFRRRPRLSDPSGDSRERAEPGHGRENGQKRSGWSIAEVAAPGANGKCRATE